MIEKILATMVILVVPWLTYWHMTKVFNYNPLKEKIKDKRKQKTTEEKING